ncbi:MAG: SRPBCC family protein [Myxococcota bacterium]
MPLLILALLSPAHADAEPKVHHIDVSRELDHPAGDVWNAIAKDYGNIANIHPLIVQSDYLKGSIEGDLGVQRSCWFDEKGKRTLVEEIAGWYPNDFTFENRVVDATRFPVDPDHTMAVYRVVPLGPQRSRIEVGFDFRTKPALLGAMAKGRFRNLLEDHLLAIDHHLRTGESVNRDNFKQVAKRYR